MRFSESAPGPAARGLWVFFIAATVGFVVLMAGLWLGRPTAILTGAGVLGFSTLAYLFTHLMATTRAGRGRDDTDFVGAEVPVDVPIPSEDPAPEPARSVAARPVARGQRPQRPSDANPFNFDHLVSHTLERVAPEPEAPRRAAPPGIVAGRSMERSLIAGAAPDPAPVPRRYEKDRVIPATQRRNEWIGGMPLIKDVLGEAAPVTDPSRPGKTRGQCSNCSTFLWAPTQRPIRLRCPNCGKTATLES